MEELDTLRANIRSMDMRCASVPVIVAMLVACQAPSTHKDDGSHLDSGATDGGSGAASVTDCTLGTWGDETDCKPEFFPASDVDASQVDLIERDYQTASAVWGNFGPLEYWIVGTDERAAQDLDAYYCSVRMDKDPSLPEEYEGYCLSREYSFEDYARDGGAALSPQHNDFEEYDVFIVTHASKYPFPDETDYTVVNYHEYFHVVQFAHIATRDQDEQRQLMVENPWWSEGGAEYMAQLLYSRQAGVDGGYLKERMSWKMETRTLLEEGERFTDIPYGERGQIGYSMGAWFIAYLIHQSSEEAYHVGFFDDLNELGWEGAFVANFGTSSEEMLDAFEVFLQLPLSEQLEIIP